MSRYAFIVKLWLETSHIEAETGPDIRGSVQLVGSEEVRYFHSLEQVGGLLQNLSGIETNEQGSE